MKISKVYLKEIIEEEIKSLMGSEMDVGEQVEQFYKYWDDYVKSSEYHVEGEEPSKEDVEKWAGASRRSLAAAVWKEVEKELEPYTFHTAVYGKTGRFK